MTQFAILYDSSKCGACKACQVQCKQWNMMPSPLGKDTHAFSGSYQSMIDLNGDTPLIITFDEQENDKSVEWAFGRRSCFHCTYPACMAVCPESAISKLEDGTVKLDSTKCNGCKYCLKACPFGIPKFRGESYGVINKCSLCNDRVAMGREPACVQTCPAGALRYGPRGKMVTAGKERVKMLKAKGFNKAELYGVTEMGGMHVLHVAKFGFEAHGLRRNPKTADTVSLFEILQPLTGLGVAAVIGGLGVSFLTGIGDEKDEQYTEDVMQGEG